MNASLRQPPFVRLCSLSAQLQDAFIGERQRSMAVMARRLWQCATHRLAEYTGKNRRVNYPHGEGRFPWERNSKRRQISSQPWWRDGKCRRL